MTTTQVLNLTDVSTSVRVNTPRGLAYVHLAPKGRVSLTQGVTVNANGLVGATGVQVKTVPKKVLAHRAKSTAASAAPVLIKAEQVAAPAPAPTTKAP